MNWSIFAALVAVIGLSSTGLLWAVKIMLRNHNAALGERFDELAQRDRGHDHAIHQLREELNDHKVDAARQYLHREDAVMFFGRAEQKIDAIWQFLHERFARGPE